MTLPKPELVNTDRNIVSSEEEEPIAIPSFDIFSMECDDEIKTEVYYNLGRLYHQLNELSFALLFYNKAMEVGIGNCLIRSAYNACLIYHSSKSYKLEFNIRKKYLSFSL